MATGYRGTNTTRAYRQFIYSRHASSAGVSSLGEGTESVTKCRANHNMFVEAVSVS